ncbi:MAG: hypothetical protein ABIG94_03360 [Pseudomonadota bacterium]
MEPCIARIEVQMETGNRKPQTANRIFRGLLCLGAMALLGLVSCAGPTTLEQDYGRSVHNNLAQQVVNPRAALDPSPAVGLSPTAAAYQMERYNKSFKGEDKKTLEMKLTTPTY